MADNDTPSAPRFAEEAEKRHLRKAQDYLANILKNSQYIDNVAAVLEKAATEMSDSATYKRADSANRNGYNLNQGQRDITDAVNNASYGARKLKEGLQTVEKLAMGSEGKLSSVQPIAGMKDNVEIAVRALNYIAAQQPNANNGLSEESVINAQAALDVVKNRLTRVVNGDANMDAALEQYNNDYAKRMAAAQRHGKPYPIPAETRTEKNYRKSMGEMDGGAALIKDKTSDVRQDGYRERNNALAEQYQHSSRKREETRTGTVSFREGIEASRSAPEESVAQR